jgi:carbon storage regulator
MLVLSRKAGEQVSIGSEIKVTVLGIHKGKVKLGFLGPPEVPIHREEIKRRIDLEHKENYIVKTLEVGSFS